MRKQYNWKIFKINRNISIECTAQDTSYGFRHLATLWVKGGQSEDTKACYYNRTWEAYTYQSVMQSLVSKTSLLSKSQKRMCKKWLEEDHTDWSQHRAIQAMAAVGDLLSNNQKDANDFKARILKAGIGEALSMPENWGTLTEDEKERRLMGAIGALA